jgi:hypothetical protein
MIVTKEDFLMRDGQRVRKTVKEFIEALSGQFWTILALDLWITF